MPPAMAPLQTENDVHCYGCYMFLERPKWWHRHRGRDSPSPLESYFPAQGSRESWKDELSPGRRLSNLNWSAPSWGSGQSDKDKVAADMKLLQQFASLSRTGDSQSIRALLADDCKFISLHGAVFTGRDAICEWMDAEFKAGKRKKKEGSWTQKSADKRKYKREMKVIFPSKAVHDVIQSAIVEDHEIICIEVKPKYPALAVALKFAAARRHNCNEEALTYVSDSVEWTTWDGMKIFGKEKVRKMWRQQKECEVKREGVTEFEASQVNEQGGCFERIMMIERIDGIKVKTRQKLYVKGELGEVAPVSVKEGEQLPCWGLIPRIVEVQTSQTEEFQNGRWVKVDEEN